MRRSGVTPALLVLAFLSASPALPQPARGAAPPRPSSFGEILRSFLPEALARLLGDAEAGCGLDPYAGSCRLQAAAQPNLTSVQAQVGCGADPYGGCSNTKSPTGSGQVPTSGH